MDQEFLFAKFYKAFKEERYADAKKVIYQAHKEGMTAGQILVKIVNRTLDQMPNKTGDGAPTTSMEVDLEAARNKFYEYLVNSKRTEAQKLMRGLIAKKIPPETMLLKIITPAMDGVGRLQEKQAINMAQIFMASKIAEDAFTLIQSLLPEKSGGVKGKIVIGNAFGDHHGLGRKIVSAFLRSYSFEVIDLGMSVPNETFADEVVRRNASVIFISAFLLTTAQQILGLRKVLTERGLHHVKIVAGGAPFSFDNQLYKKLGCDAAANNALTGVKIAQAILGAN